MISIFNLFEGEKLKEHLKKHGAKYLAGIVTVGTTARLASTIAKNKYLFEQEQQVGKIETTKNYVVEDYKNPPKEFISKYRRKAIIDKQGNRHLATFAILNKMGKKAKGVKTIMTSMWHPKSEPKVAELVQKISSEKEM